MIITEVYLCLLTGSPLSPLNRDEVSIICNESTIAYTLGIKDLDRMLMEFTFKPRFNDTDALGHINNASIATWFEEGRRPIFEFFIPDLDPKKWNLIIARVEIDYLTQGYYQKKASVKTSVEKVGNASFVLLQEAVQENIVIARGKAYLVHFDYTNQKSVPIPDSIKQKLLSLVAN